MSTDAAVVDLIVHTPHPDPVEAMIEQLVRYNTARNAAYVEYLIEHRTKRPDHILRPDLSARWRMTDQAYRAAEQMLNRYFTVLHRELQPGPAIITAAVVDLSRRRTGLLCNGWGDVTSPTHHPSALECPAHPRTKDIDEHHLPQPGWV